uniref:Reverse transcriptase Ty1/copia-type domain-containing protein n=1 Tax=Solanum lycopersicum TaxID=4081 RepID=A0A3Q7GH65_SOLLC
MYVPRLSFRDERLAGIRFGNSSFFFHTRDIAFDETTFSFALTHTNQQPTTSTPPVQQADFPVAVSTSSSDPTTVSNTQQNSSTPQQSAPITTVPPIEVLPVPPPACASNRVRHPPGYLSKYVCQFATHVFSVTCPTTSPRSGTRFPITNYVHYEKLHDRYRDFLAAISATNIPRSFRDALKDLGPLKYFLGIECARSSTSLVLCQRKYALEILQEAGLTDCKPASTPLPPGHGLAMSTSAPIRDPSKYRRLVGRLIYLTITHPNLAYSVHLLSHFMHEPRVGHLNAAMRVLRYLKGHPDSAYSWLPWSRDYLNSEIGCSNIQPTPEEIASLGLPDHNYVPLNPPVSSIQDNDDVHPKEIPGFEDFTTKSPDILLKRTS